jgi:hypothetical protein
MTSIDMHRLNRRFDEARDTLAMLADELRIAGDTVESNNVERIRDQIRVMQRLMEDHDDY